MRRTAKVARYLSFTYRDQNHEILGALFLNCRHRLLGCREIFRGTLTRVAVEPRAILKEALLAGASSFVLFHTHPSGDPEPSENDLRFTQRLAHTADAVGLCLRDHLVVCGSGRWVSLRERGRV